MRRSGLVLIALVVALGACGKSSSGPSGSSRFLIEHNARFNDGRTVRWPNLPITVFQNGIARQDEVTAWTAATGGAVTFRFVGKGSGAGITFRFRSGTDICGSSLVEYTEDGIITSAAIQVSQAIFRGPQCVRTVTHEVGHAIGIFDHTTDGGLMDDDGGDGRITEQVGQFLRELYSMPPGTFVGQAEKKLALRRSGGRRSVTFIYPVRQ